MQQVIKIPKVASDKQIEQFFIGKGLGELVKISKNKKQKNRLFKLSWNSS